MGDKAGGLEMNVVRLFERKQNMARSVRRNGVVGYFYGAGD